MGGYVTLVFQIPPENVWFRYVFWGQSRIATRNFDFLPSLHFAAFALTASEMKSLDVMVWKLSSRIHREDGGDSDDCDSSEERDIIKRAKKVIKEHLKDVSLETMHQIQEEKNKKKEAAMLKKAGKAKNTKKANVASEGKGDWCLEA